MLRPFIEKKFGYKLRKVWIQTQKIPVQIAAASRQAIIPLIQTTTHSPANRSSSRLLEIHVNL